MERILSNKILKTISLSCIFYIILFLTSAFILEKFNLQFRSAAILTVPIAFIILTISISILGMKKLYKYTKGWSVLIGIIAFGIIAIIQLYVLFFATFAYNPEHIVERYGIKMVASVSSFLQVTVYYYPYKNFIVMGKECLIYEDYGNGGYDPFTRDPIPMPQESNYYKLP